LTFGVELLFCDQSVKQNPMNFLEKMIRQKSIVIDAALILVISLLIVIIRVNKT
jgi:hypothetical protein